MALTAATPDIVDADGGARTTLSGTFVLGRSYRAYVGDDASGRPCYSGISGQGALCRPISNALLPVCLPVLPMGDVPMAVQDTVDGTWQTGRKILRAEAPFLHAMMFSMRQNIRRLFAVGPTSPEQLPAAVSVPKVHPLRLFIGRTSPVNDGTYACRDAWFDASARRLSFSPAQNPEASQIYAGDGPPVDDVSSVAAQSLYVDQQNLAVYLTAATGDAGASEMIVGYGPPDAATARIHTDYFLDSASLRLYVDTRS